MDLYHGMDRYKVYLFYLEHLQYNLEYIINKKIIKEVGSINVALLNYECETSRYINSEYKLPCNVNCADYGSDLQINSKDSYGLKELTSEHFKKHINNLIKIMYLN